MKAMKIIAIVATAVFCIAMAVGITLTAVGMEDGINTLEELFWQSEGQLSHQGPDQTASADGLKKIKLDVGAAELIVQRSDRSDIGLSYTSNRPVEGKSPVSLSESGGTLTVKTLDQTIHLWNFFRDFRLVRVVIDLPRDYSGELDAEVGAGTLTLRDQHTFSSMKVDVGAGECLMGSVKTDKADLSVSAGHIEAEKLDAVQVKLSVGIGAAELAGLTGGASIDVSTGGAELTFDRLGGDISCDVSMGSVTLELPSDTAAEVSLSASMGNADQDFGSRFAGEDRDGTLEGRLNGGGPYRISGSASMGNIQLEER
ncbi:MAG: DUF4097 domain-containing protein [Clostridiales bacterium]|jgi:hypothetical protein|nr:DUF4097 domain-containing protein [Clostridiales bacterium]